MIGGQARLPGARVLDALCGVTGQGPRPGDVSQTLNAYRRGQLERLANLGGGFQDRIRADGGLPRLRPSRDAAREFLYSTVPVAWTLPTTPVATTADADRRLQQVLRAIAAALSVTRRDTRREIWSEADVADFEPDAFGPVLAAMLVPDRRIPGGAVDEMATHLAMMTRSDTRAWLGLTLRAGRLRLERLRAA